MMFRPSLVSVISIIFLFSSLTNFSEASAFNNKSNAKRLQSAALHLPSGKYKFQNVKTGQFLTFKRTRVPNIFPASGSGTGIQISPASGNLLRLAAGNNKCVSAQWNGRLGADDAATMYACAVGSGAVGGTLRHAKQYWLAVPVSHSSIKIASAGKRMKRSASFAPGNAIEDEEGNLFDDVGMGLGEAGEHEHEHGLEKRGGVVGTVYLIAYDHLQDMRTRAIAGSSMITAGGYRSTVIKQMKAGDTSQQWKVIRA